MGGLLVLAEDLNKDLHDATARFGTFHELLGETFGGEQESAFRTYYEQILAELEQCTTEMLAISAALAESGTH